jgi:hypothetical protein
MWILLLPAIIIVHVAVGKLIPGISDLPQNLDKGFGVIFGFDKLGAEAVVIATNARTALGLCSSQYSAHVITTPPTAQPGCSLSPKPGLGSVTAAKDKDVTAPEAAIDAAFANSLTSIKRVTNDKYLGVGAFNSTAVLLNQLDNARLKAKTLSGTGTTKMMNCFGIVEQYCIMDAQGVALNNAIAGVQAEIKKITDGDMVKTFKDNKGYIQSLHAMPYSLVLAMAAFTFFWWRGGVCCCCRDGTRWGCIMIPIFMVLWLLATIMWSIIAGSAFAIKTFSKDIKVTVLKGDPSLWEVTKHLMTKFQAFWDIVFKDLYEGCEAILPASYIFVIICNIIFYYAVCECLCCPYRDAKKADDSGPPADTVGNQA